MTRALWQSDSQPDDTAQAIIEEASATREQLKINELNVGVYCFDSNWLWSALKKIKVSPKGEYYLTDLVGIAAEEGKTIRALELTDRSEAIGINTRVHLAECEAVMRKRINEKLMMAGVTIIDPATTYIEADVKIGRDTRVFRIQSSKAEQSSVRMAGLDPTRSSRIAKSATAAACYARSWNLP